MAKLKDSKIKNILTIIAGIALTVLGIRYTISARRDLIFDVLFSIIIIGAFLKYYKKLHQDYKSYSLLIFTLVLHSLFLYNTKPFGVRFEHYMHFVGGFAIAIMTDRLFNERLSKPKRFFLLLIFALGIGVIGEIIEWEGYKMLGIGEGFFKYGAGDEGGWDNSIYDLVFNSLGAVTMGILTLPRRKH